MFYHKCAVDHNISHKGFQFYWIYIEIDSTIIIIVTVVNIVEFFRHPTRLVGAIHH